MEFHIVLTAADRERLGAPDPLVYDPGHLMVSEATALYKSAGMTRQDISAALKSGNPEGKKAITWLSLRRAGVHVRYSELDFNVVGWVLVDPNPEPEADPAAGDAGGEGDAEGNSGALATEGQTPQL
ncbi:hypothetical protein [Micromonospora sp. NPDC048063]|uniref:hypothetical protein n=1 Tax=Micromonospora sp. NPDC048063 TaxID=3364256 RepID=UPI003720A46F